MIQRLPADKIDNKEKDGSSIDENIHRVDICLHPPHTIVQVTDVFVSARDSQDKGKLSTDLCKDRPSGRK